MNDLMIIAEVVTAVLIVVSLVVTAMLLKSKKRGTKTPNYRGMFVFGMIWFFVGLVLMVAYVLVDVPFWIGLPVAVLGLLYQFAGLWRQQKTTGT